MAPGVLHKDLTERSIKWLRGRLTGKGMRGDREVYVAQGYVADAVALGNLQQRYDLEYWANHHQDRQFNHRHHERHHEQAFVFEAKATRSDFLSTFGSPYGNHENRFTPIGTHHWVVIAKGIVKPEEIENLQFWGVLIQSGNGLREIRPPYWCNIERQNILKLAHTILWK